MIKRFKNTKLIKSIAGITLALCVLLGLYGAGSLSKLKTLYSVMQFLPTHHPALQMDKAVRQKFHLKDNPTYIGLIELKNQNENWFTPEKIRQLSRLTARLERYKSVVQVVTLANVQGAADVKNTITVGKIVDLTPKKMWEHRFLNDQLLSPTLISKDGRTVMVYVQLKSANVKLLAWFESELKRNMQKYFPNENSSVGGVPAVQTDLGTLLNDELRNFIALTLVACVLTLLLIFRTWSSIFIPLILTGFCNLMVFAVMAWTGLAFTILSSTIPILVFIAVLSISVHILLRVHEDSKKSSARRIKWHLIKGANLAIWLPNLMGTVTTCVGFLTLLTSDVPMIREFGIGVAMAVMVSWLLTSIGILPLLILFPLPQARDWVHNPARWVLWVINKRKWVVGLTLALCISAAIVGQNLDWSGKLFDDLPEGQEARQSTETIDSSMGGVVPMELVIKLPKGVDWNDPVRMETLDQLLIQFRNTEGVGSAKSLPDFLRASGVEGSRLPSTRQGIAEIYFLYSFAPANPITQYLTNDSRSTRIEMKMRDLPADIAQVTSSKLKAMAESRFPDSEIQIGGMAAVIHIIHHEISSDLIFGFWQALGIIIILLMFVFRSLRWSLVAAIPNLVPPILLLGYLAITKTPIKPGVAIIFSIALGLAFNNTLFALNRLRSLRSKIKPMPVEKTFYYEANPCMVSTLVVMMGFSVFMFSYFSLNRTFGICMLVAILAGILGDLIFLPALLKLAPWLLTYEIPFFGKMRDKVENYFHSKSNSTIE